MTWATAFLFPGQGSQAVGMLDALGARHPEALDCLREASEVLSQDLLALATQGPAEALDDTVNTQPVMLAAGVAVWRLWRSLGGPEPAALAGHSLGEYTALTCAGAFSFEDALRLVRERARLMRAAAPPGAGMVAALGPDAAEVEALCRAATDGAASGEIVEPVNYNAPGQTVVAGHADALARFKEALAGHGRCVELPVGVPAHSSLMRGAAEELAARLADTPVAKPRLPVLHNLDAATRAAPDDIRAALVAQLHSPVRWDATMRQLLDAGAAACAEAGPGKVLTGLARRIDKRAVVHPLATPAGLDKALAEWPK